MADIQPEHVTYLEDHIDLKLFDLIYYGTFLSVRPLNGNKKLIYDTLKKIPHLKTYLKEDIPPSTHYRNNRRIMDIFALAEEGYYFVPDRTIHVHNHTFGNHGYNNTLASMYGVFLAHGPHFRKDLKIDSIQNIHLYELMCHILDLEPHPNNGSLSSVAYILRESQGMFAVLLKRPVFVTTLVVMSGILLTVLLVGLLISCLRYSRRESEYSRLNSEIPLSQFHDDEDDFVEFESTTKSSATKSPTLR